MDSNFVARRRIIAVLLSTISHLSIVFLLCDAKGKKKSKKRNFFNYKGKKLLFVSATSAVPSLPTPAFLIEKERVSLVIFCEKKGSECFRSSAQSSLFCNQRFIYKCASRFRPIHCRVFRQLL